MEEGAPAIQRMLSYPNVHQALANPRVLQGAAPHARILQHVAAPTQPAQLAAISTNAVLQKVACCMLCTAKKGERRDLLRPSSQSLAARAFAARAVVSRGSRLRQLCMQ